MYQGKFQAPKGAAKKVVRSTKPVAPIMTDLDEIDAQLAALHSNTGETPVSTAPETKAPVTGQASPAPKTVPVQKSTPKAAPKKDGSPKKGKKVSLDPKEQSDPAIAKLLAKKKRKSKINTMIFYGIYFLLIAGFFLLLSGGLTALKDWLVTYEAKQPTVKSQEVFNQLFQNPDWENIYTLAGGEDTQFESAENYAKYMQQKIGDDALTYLETSAGLDKNLHKYVVKYGEEKVAVYTLTCPEHGELDLPQWDLGTVEIFMERKEDATVRIAPGQTVYINGKPLNEDYMIRSTSTLAESYLPEGIHGYASKTFYIDGLLVEPEITVKDDAGNAVELTYSQEEGLYTVAFERDSMVITDAEKQRAIDAAKTLAKFRIERADQATLARYFDSSSTYYKDTVAQDTWMQNFSHYSFTEPKVTNYCRYSDELYSVYVDITLKVTRNNGTVREYPMNSTMFFTKKNGSWLVTDSTNIQIQQDLDTVRLIYIQDGETLAREMVQFNASQIKPPAVTVPEGKVFAGWFRETAAENGNTTLSLVFKPDETTGLVYLAEGTTLEPMVLYARFENAGGAG